MEQALTKLHKFWQWLLQDRHKQHVRVMAAQVEHAFTEHPRQTGETYLKHLWFTLKMTMRLAYSSFVLLIHGIFPFLFTKTASSQVEIIWAIMRSRIPEQRREELKQTWHI